MARKSFAAHCARNHDRIDFTDPAAFEAHMTGEHKARKPVPGGRIVRQLNPISCDSTASVTGPNETRRGAPGMDGGRILPPHEWKAPRPAPGGMEKVAERIAAGEYEWPGRQWSGHRDKGTPAGEVVAA